MDLAEISAAKMCAGCQMSSGKQQDTREHLIAVPHGLKEWIANRAAAWARNLYEVLRFVNREHFEHHSINQAEDCCVGANAERQREHRHGGKAGRLAERARAIAQVLS